MSSRLFSRLPSRLPTSPILTSPFIRTMSSSSAIKPIELYSLGTPNGMKVAIFCEELKAAYPDSFDYKSTKIDISKNTQKEEWFLKINPNGRIPAIVDPNRNNFPVFETAAILLYLEKHYDPEHKFSVPSDSQDHDDFRSEVLQWMFFVHGGVGPMQGQANHFSQYAPERIPYAIKRYQDETRRLYDVLEIKLKGKDWLVGTGKGSYSIADMNAVPWVIFSPHAGIPRDELPPSVKAWVERSLKREAVMKGLFDCAMGGDGIKKMIETGVVAAEPKWKAED